MSDKPPSWEEKIPPGGRIFIALLGIGAGAWALMMGIGMGIEAVGAAKRHYPEVAMGIIVIGLAIATFISSKH